MTTDRARIAQPPVDPGPDHAGEDELLTVDDVCAWFKVTRDWVYDEVEAGRLPYIRLGRKHLRFRRHELNDYLTGAARRPGPRPHVATPTLRDTLEPLE